MLVGESTERILVAAVRCTQTTRILELPSHPFYVGVQFHPEFKSRPGRASALFLGEMLYDAAAEGGLDHCHSNDVLHCDLKGANLLINNNGILKMADFGLATFCNSSQPLISRVIALWYRPPELLFGAKHYGPAIDLWSAGCILGELYTGKSILRGRTEIEQLHRIFQLCGSPSEDFWEKLKLPPSKPFGVQPQRRRIAEKLKDVPASTLGLLETLLSMHPESCGTAARH